MALLSDIVAAVLPAPASTGIPLSVNIQILFTKEIDEDSIINGGVFVEGKGGTDLLFTDYSQSVVDGSSADYSGFIPGAFTFKRISLTSNSEVTTADTTGNGQLYRTKVIFTPTLPLNKTSSYSLYLVADPDTGDDIKFGIKTRSVFDPLKDNENTGTGDVQSFGSYSGNFQDIYNIQFVEPGVVGTARFEWWKNSDPLNIRGPVTTSYGKAILSDGVQISFKDGTFDLNDRFTITAKPGEVFTETLISSFTTGSGSIAVVPDTASSSVTGDILPPAALNRFEIVKTSPEDFQSNIPLSSAGTIVVEFSEDINPATVTPDSVQVIAEPVTDHPGADIVSPNGKVAKKLTVSGNKLIITL